MPAVIPGRRLWRRAATAGAGAGGTLNAGGRSSGRERQRKWSRLLTAVIVPVPPGRCSVSSSAALRARLAPLIRNRRGLCWRPLLLTGSAGELDRRRAQLAAVADIPRIGTWPWWRVLRLAGRVQIAQVQSRRRAPQLLKPPAQTGSFGAQYHEVAPANALLRQGDKIAAAEGVSQAHQTARRPVFRSSPSRRRSSRPMPPRRRRPVSQSTARGQATAPGPWFKMNRSIDPPWRG